MILAYQFILLIALLSSLRLRPQAPKFFNPFLVAFVLLEALSKIFKETGNSLHMPTLNLSALGSVGYYLYVFLQASRPKLIPPAWAAYLLSILVSLYVQGPYTIMNIAYNTGMILVLVALFGYLYQLILKNEFTPLHKVPLFWLAVGVMIFFSSVFPMLTFGLYLYNVDHELGASLWSLVSYGNIFLALGFLAVSLCQLNTRTSSSPSP